ncbi:alpha/beta fold hydrolase [Embleya sp. NPDC001921]
MSYARVNGIDLYFEDSGSGTPLLFLHGWGTCGRVWDDLAGELDVGHRVVTVDGRGCGRSDRPSTGNTVADNAADVTALIDVLELDRPILVGSSLGAAFALEVALNTPERVSGIVSVSGSGHWPGQGMTERLRALRVALATDRAETLAAWVPQWFAPGADPRLVDSTVGRILASGLAIDELFDDAAAHDPRAAVRELAVPAAFVHGRLDGEIPLEVSRTLAELAPHGELHVVEGAGHMAHQEQPASVAAVLRTVTARCGRA